MTGGLGNQMFIYAFYLAMKQRFRATRIDLSDMAHYRVHNGYELHRIFPSLEADEFLIGQKTKKVIEFLFFKTILERKQDLTTLRAFTRPRLWPLVYFKGFYQDERYFADVAADVRRAFTFDESLASERTRRLLAQIDADPAAVSLHVRRGDYLTPRTWRSNGCVCTADYYRDAVRRIATDVPRAHFYVFSDDIAWATTNLRLPDATFVTWNTGADSWQDMLLMSRCRHHVVCNSTFSWWGAWLNPREDKIVVAPTPWTTNGDCPHICPPSWTLIPVTPATGGPSPE